MNDVIAKVERIRRGQQHLLKKEGASGMQMKNDLITTLQCPTKRETKRVLSYKLIRTYLCIHYESVIVILPTPRDRNEVVFNGITPYGYVREDVKY